MRRVLRQTKINPYLDVVLHKIAQQHGKTFSRMVELILLNQIASMPQAQAMYEALKEAGELEEESQKEGN